MLNLIRAEWLKLARRPLAWMLLVIFLALLALQILGEFTIVQMLGAIGPGEGSALGADQLAEYQRRIVFPGLFGVVFGHFNGLGGIFAIILAAGAMGNEYSWGTLRTQLARDPNRSRYLLAKIAALLSLLAVATLITLLVGVAIGAAIGAITGNVGAVSAADLAALPLAIVRALFVLLPYVLLTLCFTILGRSVLLGVAGGLIYLVFEIGFSALALLQLLGGVWLDIYNLTIQQNISVMIQLNNHAFGLRPELLTPQMTSAAPPPLQATLVIAIYSLSFLTTALWMLRRHDIGGAA